MPTDQRRLSRREALQYSMLWGVAAAAWGGCASPKNSADENGVVSPWSARISLAQWTFHRAIKSGALDAMDFAPYANEQVGVRGVEYVNTFYRSLPSDGAWARTLRQRAQGAGVESLLIMVDGEGMLGAQTATARREAVDAHRRWLDVASVLGCHSIRVNALGEGDAAAQVALCADGMSMLCELAAKQGLWVLIENHGGFSCDGAWVADIVRKCQAKNLGTLPDFGNFRCADGSEYDRYKGVEAMLPFARALSAKSQDFTADCAEMHTDYSRMLRLVQSAHYSGWIGIEYEGKVLGEVDGARRTRDLLLRLGCRI